MTSADPVAIVEAFLDCIVRGDLDGAKALAHEDIVYINQPFVWTRSRSLVSVGIRACQRLSGPWDVRMLNIAADGDNVLTERVDVVRFGPLEFAWWCCGTAEVRDGRIAVWRDRFDYVDFFASVPRGVMDLVLPGVRKRLLPWVRVG